MNWCTCHKMAPCYVCENTTIDENWKNIYPEVIDLFDDWFNEQTLSDKQKWVENYQRKLDVSRWYIKWRCLMCWKSTAVWPDNWWCYC